MQYQNQSSTPQFIKTADYQEDHVQNSLEMGGVMRSSGNGRDYRSPGRGGYQAKYPTSFGGQMDRNIHQNVGLGRYSDQKYDLSPGRYGGSNGKVPMNMMSNKNISIETVGNNKNNNNQLAYSNNHNHQQQQYSSNGYSNNYLSSPYVSQSYHHTNNYNSSQNNNNNYNPSMNNYPLSNNLLSHQLSSITNSRSIIELQKLTSQLKLSLQQSLSNQSLLQDQLNKQKVRSFQLSQVKRKLQEQLSKMEFQLDRISNVDVLGQRQLMVKYQAQILQNQRLNSQLNDTMEELRRVKTQCRDLMSENSKIRQQCEILRTTNGQLLTQMDSLVQQVNSIKHQCNQSALRERQLMMDNQHLMKSQLVNNNNGNGNGNDFVYGVNKKQGIPQNGQGQLQQQVAYSSGHLNSIHTTRTDNYDSTKLSRYGANLNPLGNSQTSQNDLRFKSPQKHISQQAYLSGNHHTNNHMPQSPNQQFINYDLQNSKLVDDYNKLQMENQAMKKLYKKFYQQSPKKSNFQSPPSYQKSISQHSEEFESTSPNFYHKVNGYLEDGQQHMQNEMLQTFQRNQLYSQIASLRQQVIKELMTKYFTHSLQQAQTKKVNVLIVFIKLMTKDIEIIERMVVNYLQARDILKKELNVKRLTEGQEGQPNTQFEVEAEGMWANVKEKLKNELKQHKKPKTTSIDQSEIATLNINAYYLALFRLLTLIQKYETKFIETSSKTLDKIKHSALKYVHKIHEETHQLKHNHMKNDIQHNRHPAKVSLRK